MTWRKANAQRLRGRKKYKCVGYSPFWKRLAKTACLPDSQKVEMFSGNVRQETTFQAINFLFLLMFSRLQLPKSVGHKISLHYGHSPQADLTGPISELSPTIEF
jgi:hypothetical protein